MKKPTITSKGPNKEVKAIDKSGNIKVTNITEQEIKHRGGIIKVGGTGKVIQYEADLFRRKKLVV
jgi:hypothetical protein